MRRERAERRMPDGEAPPRSYPAKKDRKRWCGGHEGREHKIVVGRKKAWASSFFGQRNRLPVIRYCATCGKELDIHFWWQKKRKPEWVTRFLEAEGAE